MPTQSSGVLSVTEKAELIRPRSVTERVKASGVLPHSLLYAGRVTIRGGRHRSRWTRDLLVASSVRHPYGDVRLRPWRRPPSERPDQWGRQRAAASGYGSSGSVRAQQLESTWCLPVARWGDVVACPPSERCSSWLPCRGPSGRPRCTSRSRAGTSGHPSWPRARPRSGSRRRCGTWTVPSATSGTTAGSCASGSGTQAVVRTSASARGRAGGTDRDRQDAPRRLRARSWTPPTGLRRIRS